MKQTNAKNFRKRTREVEGGGEDQIFSNDASDDDEQERRLVLEEVKFLQKQREKKSGLPAIISAAGEGGHQQSNNGGGGLVSKAMVDKNNNINNNEGGGGGDAEKDELVLQDTFAQETAVMVEDPNMLRYVEQELAKKRGKKIDVADQVENDIKHAEDELYKIPDHLKVKRRNSEESSTQWTTGIAEIQLPIEYKLKNIEETEAAKKLLQEKRLIGRTKTDSTIPSSYSADYFQRGKDYAEKLRREHPELYKDKGAENNGLESKPTTDSTNSSTDAAAAAAGGRRQAATDEFMLERFRKRERHRGIN
ncbi:hypothetical protein LguiB_000006 [Lonicera macranthoides]